MDRPSTNQTKPSTPGRVLITDASRGIGYEPAAEFAARDWDLLICAEDDGIDRAAQYLAALGNGEVRAIREDLGGYGGVEQGGRQRDAVVVARYWEGRSVVSGDRINPCLGRGATMTAPQQYELVFSDHGRSEDVVTVYPTGQTGPGGHPVYADETGIIRAEISAGAEVRMLPSGGGQRPARNVTARSSPGGKAQP